VPLTGFDLADWLPRVRARFEDVAPELLLDLKVRVNDTESVLALFFDPTRAPFVVKTAPATPSRGCPDYEVPWREGTMLRAALRRDLLRILEPMATIPSIEVLQCVVSGDLVNGEFAGRIDGSLYVVPNSGERIVVPFHRCRIDLTSDRGSGAVSECRLVPPNLPAMARHSPPPTTLVSATYSELILDGPGMIAFGGPIHGRFSARPEVIRVSFRLGVAHSPQPLLHSCELGFVSGSTGRDTWKLLV